MHKFVLQISSRCSRVEIAQLYIIDAYYGYQIMLVAAGISHTFEKLLHYITNIKVRV